VAAADEEWLLQMKSGCRKGEGTASAVP